MRRRRAGAGKARPSPGHGKRAPRPASAALFAQLISRAGNCPATHVYGWRRAPLPPLGGYPCAPFPCARPSAPAPSLPPHCRCPLPAPLPRPRPEGSEPFGPRGCPGPAGGRALRRGAAPGGGGAPAAGRAPAPGSGSGCAGSGGGRRRWVSEGVSECGGSAVPGAGEAPPGRGDGERVSLGLGCRRLGCWPPLPVFGLLLREFVHHHHQAPIRSPARGPLAQLRGGQWGPPFAPQLPGLPPYPCPRPFPRQTLLPLCPGAPPVVPRPRWRTKPGTSVRGSEGGTAGLWLRLVLVFHRK